MLSAYPACFFKEGNSYSVVFPDLNCLATSGATFDEALHASVDCLAGYLYLLKKNNDDIPPSSSIDEIHADDISAELGFSDFVSESFVNMVTVEVDEYAKNHFEKSVKKTLTIPLWLNNAALEQGVNFSQVLQNALMAELNIGQR